MYELKVKGPRELLEQAAKKLEENGFKKDEVHFTSGTVFILFIRKDSFFIGNDGHNIVGSGRTISDVPIPSKNICGEWSRISSLQPELPFDEEDWVWAETPSNRRTALVKWTEEGKAYGFNFSDRWTNMFYLHNDMKPLVLTRASQEEVEERLKQEAIERGFVEEVLVNNKNLILAPARDKRIRIREADYQSVYYKNDNVFRFCVGGVIIMQDGKWAKIVAAKEFREGHPSEYQLLEWYPGLPEDWKVGMKVKQDLYDSYYPYHPVNDTYTNQTIEAEEVQENPKFWKKI